MNILLAFTVHTLNILGGFSDPFEFEGDYGPEMNPARQEVFALVVPQEALTRHLSEFEKLEAIEKDNQHGPTLSALATPALMEELINKQRELEHLGFTNTQLENMRAFVKKYGDKKIFRFFRNFPPELLSLDKILRDKAAREGKQLDLPILSSTYELKETNSFDLKNALLQKVFTPEILLLSKPESILIKAVQGNNEAYLKQFFGEEADRQDLEVFCTPAGQLFFYWLYQSLNLHLIAENQDLIKRVNKVKTLFFNGLGDPSTRARLLKEKLIAADSEVLFTQESDAFIPEGLQQNALFLPVDQQNPRDGCFVFLRSDVWESDYQIIPVEDYENYPQGKISLILATRKNTGEKFLLAACHGHSTKAEDGRLQLSFVMQKFKELSQSHEGLQLIIGADANTKSKQDVELLREQADALGLIMTNMGPTTIKKRMVTVQNGKAGKAVMDEEDYIMTLKPEKGGRYSIQEQTIGWSSSPPDLEKPLPHFNNPFDHYPVGASLTSP